MYKYGRGEFHNKVSRYLGLSIIWGAGLLMGVLELQHIDKMSSTLGVTVFALLPFIINLGLFGAGFGVWKSDLDGKDTLRIAGWMLLGIAVIGLLALWTITHQNIRGRTFAHARFVAINNMTVGALVGFLLGWYHVRSHRHQQQVIEEQAKLETREQRLEVLHRVLRHNLRNDLNVISGYVQELESAPRTEVEDAVQIITKKTNALMAKSEKIRQMMISLDQESGPTVVNVATVCSKSIRAMEESKPDVEVVSELPANVWGYAISETLLRNAITHLLENAIEHNDSADPRVTVSVLPAERDSDGVVVQIADNGPGIPETEQEVLSKSRETSLSHGSGIGLWLVYWIVSESGGELWFEENYPRGSVVLFSLPSATPPNQ